MTYWGYRYLFATEIYSGYNKEPVLATVFNKYHGFIESKILKENPHHIVKLTKWHEGKVMGSRRFLNTFVYYVIAGLQHLQLSDAKLVVLLQKNVNEEMETTGL